MNARSMPVLAITDLSARSDYSLHCAAVLANELDTELQVLHAMALTGRTLREAVPILQDVSGAIRAAERSLHAQIRRAVPAETTVGAARVDVHATTPAVLSMARQIDPAAIVVPAGWEWQRFGGDRTALSHRSLGKLRAPLLISARHGERTLTNRVAIIAHPDALDAGIVHRAAQWNHWVARMNTEAGRLPVCPDFDVFLLDDSMAASELCARVEGRGADLIAVATDSLEQSDAAPAATALLNRLTVCATTPTVMLPAVPRKETASAVNRVAIMGGMR